MKRLSILVALWFAPAACSWGETLELKGDIYDAHFEAFRTTNVSSNGNEIVATLEPFIFDVTSNGPLPYVGTFSYWPDSQYAAFQYTVIYDGSPLTEDFGNLFEGILQIDADALELSHVSSLSDVFVLNLHLSLDRATGQGGWEWSHPCLSCDQVGDFARAFATITSLRAIPEPSSVAIAFLGLLPAMLSCRRRNIPH